MTRAQQIDVAKELGAVENVLEALLSGREAALASGAWRAAVRAVYALCSVPPSQFRQLLQQTSEILRWHLNSVRADILDPNTADSGQTHAAPGKAAAAPVDATAASADVVAHLSRVGANLRLNLASIFKDAQPHLNCEAPKALLERYATAWETFLETIKKMDQLYTHFNLQLLTLRKAQDLNEDSQCPCEEPRIYTPCSVTYDTWPTELKEIALHKWLECVLVPAGKPLRKAITRALRSECEARPFVERAVLKTVIDSFVDVREFDTIDKTALRREWVVQPYLAAVRGRHDERAQVLLAEGEEDLSNFMSHMLAVNVQELVTLLPYFGEEVCKEVQINFQQVAVVPHLRRLWAAAPGLVAAAAGRSSTVATRHDLHHLFLLLRVVDALPPLLDAAQAYVIMAGRAMLARPPPPGIEMHDHFVDVIMRHRQMYSMLFTEVFEGEKLFCQDVLDKVLRDLVNGDIPDVTAASGGGRTTWRAPELLARYCDALLRRRDDAFMEIRLAAASFIFLNLDEKDVFQDTYQKMLAKRLLNHSSSLRMEEILITKLRHARTEFNGKLHAMCKDIAASFALNEKFREWTEKKREPFSWGGDEDCREHSAQVLQGWAWPIANVPTPWMVPAPLASYTNKFEAFYKELHPRRRLTWLLELCTGELALCYTARRYELVATGVQCGLLLAFHDRDQWCAEELRGRLRLTRADWAKQLQPLLKLRLLLPAGDVLSGNASGEDVQGGDVLAGECGASQIPCAALILNLDFSHEWLKIKITCSKESAKQPAPSPAAQEQAPSRRDLRCKAYTQALLMRIMKKRRVLQHDKLLQEMKAQSNGWFSPAPELVKTYIDELIFKEYLEPLPGDSHTYKYLP